MNLREYVRSLRRRSKLITITALLFVALAGVLTYQATPKYRSTTDLFVSTGQDDNTTAYTGSLYSAQRVQSYARLAMEPTSRDVSRWSSASRNRQRTCASESARPSNQRP